MSHLTRRLIVVSAIVLLVPATLLFLYGVFISVILILQAIDVGLLGLLLAVLGYALYSAWYVAIHFLRHDMRDEYMRPDSSGSSSRLALRKRHWVGITAGVAFALLATIPGLLDSERDADIIDIFFLLPVLSAGLLFVRYLCHKE